MYQPYEPWELLLQKQPQWIQNFIKHVEYRKMEEILNSVSTCDHLIMVSDDSGKDYYTTFAWVLSTPDDKRLATAAGNCQGRESSLRAESTGMLSASVFMVMIQLYRDEATIMIKMRYISDNLELINRGIEHGGYEESYPNTTLRAEYHVAEQIYLINQAHKIEATYSWVKVSKMMTQILLNYHSWLS